MRETRTVLCIAAFLLAGQALAAPADAGPKVGDRLAPYTPARNVNVRGKLKCETC